MAATLRLELRAGATLVFSLLLSRSDHAEHIVRPASKVNADAMPTCRLCVSACAARLSITFHEAGYVRRCLLYYKTAVACGSRGGGANALAAVAGVGGLRGGGDGRHAAEVAADPLAHPGMDNLPVKPALKVCTDKTLAMCVLGCTLL